MKRTFVVALIVSAAIPTVLADSYPQRIAQDGAIQLGTSGGNVNDISRRYCCSGTLGALVQDGAGVQYILSNNHVLARVNQASIGEAISQPGLIDDNCGVRRVVANFSRAVPIAFSSGRKSAVNYVDAAIAQVQGGAVDSSGAIIQIGVIDPNPVTPFVGQQVQKSGRTTGLTKGAVGSIDNNVKVAYSTTCGGANNLVAVYAGQIIVNSSTFSAGGDSGSLIVDLPSSGNPHPVGLLFAGSSTTTVFNPINAVLSELGVTMVGAKAQATDVTQAGGEPVQLVQARAAKAANSQALLDLPNVVGHGISEDENGQPIITVYLDEDSPQARRRIPPMLGQTPVRVIVTGPFVAF